MCSGVPQPRAVAGIGALAQTVTSPARSWSRVKVPLENESVNFVTVDPYCAHTVASTTVWVEYGSAAQVFATTGVDGTFSRGQLRTGDIRVCASGSDFVTPDTTTCTTTFHIQDWQAITGLHIVVP